MVELMRKAFGTSMFSQRPDTGYLPDCAWPSDPLLLAARSQADAGSTARVQQTETRLPEVVIVQHLVEHASLEKDGTVFLVSVK